MKIVSPASSFLHTYLHWIDLAAAYNIEQEWEKEKAILLPTTAPRCLFAYVPTTFTNATRNRLYPHTHICVHLYTLLFVIEQMHEILPMTKWKQWPNIKRTKAIYKKCQWKRWNEKNKIKKKKSKRYKRFS